MANLVFHEIHLIIEIQNMNSALVPAVTLVARGIAQDQDEDEQDREGQGDGLGQKQAVLGEKFHKGLRKMMWLDCACNQRK